MSSTENEPLIPPTTTTTGDIANDVAVFLPLTYALSNKNDKHVTVGLIRHDQSYTTCVCFTAAPHKRITLPYHVWNVLQVNFHIIAQALSNRKKVDFTLNDIADSSLSTTGPHVYVKPLFGKWYVQLADAEGRQRISLSPQEWTAFNGYRPLLSQEIFKLWREERSIVSDLESHLSEGDDAKPPVNNWWAGRLRDEVFAYRYIQKEAGGSNNEPNN